MPPFTDPPRAVLHGVKSNPFVEASGEDFALGEPLERPGGGHWTPYALDADLRTLHWSRTPEPAASYDAPFLYLAQYRHADALGTSCPLRLPEAGGGRRTFVFSVGRCGSTLLTRMAEAGGLAALSEPDALVALGVRPKGCRERGDKLYAPLLDAVIRSSGLDPSARTLVKLRAQHSTPDHLSRIRRALPEADFVFVFREPRAWARSMVGHFGLDVDRLLALYDGAARACAEALASGAQARVLLFEDMANDGAATATALGLADDLTVPCDSAQSGTRLARKPEPDADGLRTVDAFMREWPGIARGRSFLPY